MKSLAKHFSRIRNDDERARIGILHKQLEPRHLVLADDGHQHGTLLAREAALALQLGEAAVEVDQHRLRYLVRLRRYDEGGLGCLQAGLYDVDRLARDEQADEGVERVFGRDQDAGREDDEAVKRGDRKAEAQAGEAVQDLCGRIEAACGRLAAEDEAEAETYAEAAVDGGEQRVVRRRRPVRGQQHEQRQHDGADGGLDAEAAAEDDEARYEKRDVERPLDIGRLDVDKAVHDDRDAGHAARGDLVRQEEEVEADRDEKGARQQQRHRHGVAIERGARLASALVRSGGGG